MARPPRPRLPALLLLAGAVALIALVPASARTETNAKYGSMLVVGPWSDVDGLDPTLSSGFVEVYLDGIDKTAGLKTVQGYQLGWTGIRQFVQAQADAVGFDVVIDAVDSAATVALRTNGQFDASFGGFTPGGVDPISTIRLATWDSAGYRGYSNPRLDLILRDGVKATTQRARSTLYRAAEQIILADRPYVPFFNPLNVAAFSANVAGVELNTEGVLDVAHARFT